MDCKRSGIDIAMIVFGIIMFILAISLFAILGQMSSASPFALSAINSAQWGVAAWFLLTAIFSILSGATAHKCPYVTVIVFGIIGIFIALGGGIAGTIALTTNLFAGLGSSAVRSVFLFGRRRSYSSSRRSSSFSSSFNSISSIVSLPWGIVAIDFLSFIFLIVISCISCCGTCCNNSAQAPAQPATTVVYANPPPGYVNQPPGGHTQPAMISGVGIELKHV